MEIFSGIVGLVLVALLLLLAVSWLIFPWVVRYQLNKLIKGQDKLAELLKAAAMEANGHLGGIAVSVSPPKAKVPAALPVAVPAEALIDYPQAEYYLSTDGQQQGPISAADLRIMRKDGLITDETFLCRDGDSEWKPYRSFLALSR